MYEINIFTRLTLPLYPFSVSSPLPLVPTPIQDVFYFLVLCFSKKAFLFKLATQEASL
jgi:hypothetical protein